jgi:hypothetical protein
MQRIVWVEEMLVLAAQKEILEIESQLLLQMAPEALYNCVMDALDLDVERVDGWIDVGGVHSSECHQIKIVERHCINYPYRSAAINA